MNNRHDMIILCDAIDWCSISKPIIFHLEANLLFYIGAQISKEKKKENYNEFKHPFEQVAKHDNFVPFHTI